jgi:hypothetical protein
VQVGDLVKTVRRCNRRGILVERVYDPIAMNNKVFKVMWTDGTIGNNVWDYDLEVISGIS